MADDPYITIGPDPSGDPASRYVTADQQGVARLRQSERPAGEWNLTSLTPAIFNPVSFQADDLEDAEAKAVSWIGTYLRTEGAYLFEDDD